MLGILDRLSASPARDVRELLQRVVAFILMGNTDAHLKNWALLYPDAVQPVLAPIYDPVCVAAWFAELGPKDYAVNRNIDAVLRAVDESTIAGWLTAADVPRASRLRALVKETVAAARARWPAILVDAPDNVRASVSERLAGGVALAR
jgi:serine/threonine-protein kinase HipA